MSNHPSHPPHSPAEALQAVLMLLNWQTSLVQAALDMLRESGKGEKGPPSAKDKPARRRGGRGRQT